MTERTHRYSHGVECEVYKGCQMSIYRRYDTAYPWYVLVCVGDDWLYGKGEIARYTVAKQLGLRMIDNFICFAEKQLGGES